MDVANLSARMAVQTATIEQIMQLTQGIDPSTWVEIESPAKEGEDLVGIPASQAPQLQALLSAIASVQ